MPEPQKFIRAHNTLTGLIQRIPIHWLQPGSPFPHFKSLPSAKAKEAATTDAKTSQAPPATTRRAAKKATAKRGSADTTKE